MTAIFFQKYAENVCCLCGYVGGLTTEHKIKASAIRSEFGTEPMIVFNYDFGTTARLLQAQGPKAKTLQFRPSLCFNCNSTSTQPADKAFDAFHAEVSNLSESGHDPSMVYGSARFAPGTQAYLETFRYFAKLLCCHIAHSKGARPVRLSNFALGQSKTNCVWLQVRYDPTYQRMKDQIGELDYAAHGGLAVYCSRNGARPTGFHSSLTLGSVQYVFYHRLSWFEQLTLRYVDPEFYGRLVAIGQEAIRDPIPEHERRSLGL